MHRRILTMLLAVNLLVAQVSEWQMWSKVAVAVNALALLGSVCKTVVTKSK